MFEKPVLILETCLPECYHEYNSVQVVFQLRKALCKYWWLKIRLNSDYFH